MSPPMVQTVGGGLLVSPSLAQTRGCTLRVRRPRVAIDGSNRGFSRLTWSAEPTLLSVLWYKPWCQPLLVSLTWFKPRERLSLANRWMCQYPYDKNTGVRTMVQTGGKVTCCNRGVRYNHVSQPRGVRYNRELQPLVSELLSCWGESACNHWVQPRGVRYNHGFVP